MSAQRGPGFYCDPMGESRWWDGEKWGVLESEAPSLGPELEDSELHDPGLEGSEADSAGADESNTEDPSDEKAASPDPQKSSLKKSLWWLGSAVGAVLVVLLVLTFGVDRWEKVIEPEHPETFHTVEVESGVYSVEMSSDNPCFVGQDWFDCINRHISEYNHACADRSLDARSSRLCSDYLEMIDEMEAENPEYGSYVEGLGDWGRLAYAPILTTEQVSNDDYRPAKTRDAICILWVFGECKWHEDADASTPYKDTAPTSAPGGTSASTRSTELTTQFKPALKR